MISEERQNKYLDLSGSPHQRTTQKKKKDNA